MNKESLRIGFIGAGSIGSLFGGYLADLKSETYSIEVIFFCLREHADVINKKGLNLIKNQQNKIIKNIKAYENEKIIEATLKKDLSFKFDFVFLTTKTYDIEAAVIQYKNIIDASKFLVILQNGIGNEEMVSKYCNNKSIIRAVTTNGGLLDKPGHIVHTGKGITKIGLPLFKDLSLNGTELEQAKSYLMVLKDILNSAGLETVIVDDIIRESWEKVMVNVGINAIGALTRLTNGELLENAGLKFFIEKVIGEAVEVAVKSNISLSKKDYVSMTYDVLRKTSNNKNSMLQDILNKKSTEINFLNGRIVKIANDINLDVPYNEFLTYLIKSLEYSRI